MSNSNSPSHQQNPLIKSLSAHKTNSEVDQTQNNNSQRSKNDIENQSNHLSFKDLCKQCASFFSKTNNSSPDKLPTLVQYLTRCKHFKQSDKQSGNFNTYLQQYASTLKLETFPIQSKILSMTSRMYFLLSGSCLLISPKKDASSNLPRSPYNFGCLVERIAKKIKSIKDDYNIGKENNNISNKESLKDIFIEQEPSVSVSILQPGDAFGEINTPQAGIVVLEETTVLSSSSSGYIKSFEMLLTKNSFIMQNMTKILPFIDKDYLIHDVLPLFIELKTYLTNELIFQKDQNINRFYILRQGQCQIIQATDGTANISSSSKEGQDGQSNQSGVAVLGNVKQGDFFGHEDIIGNNDNKRLFECRVIVDNTIVYSIEKDKLFGLANQKIRHLILNNAFAKYHSLTINKNNERRQKSNNNSNYNNSGKIGYKLNNGSSQEKIKDRLEDKNIMSQSKIEENNESIQVNEKEDDKDNDNQAMLSLSSPSRKIIKTDLTRNNTNNINPKQQRVISPLIFLTNTRLNQSELSKKQSTKRSILPPVGCLNSSNSLYWLDGFTTSNNPENVPKKNHNRTNSITLLNNNSFINNNNNNNNNNISEINLNRIKIPTNTVTDITSPLTSSGASTTANHSNIQSLPVINFLPKNYLNQQISMTSSTQSLQSTPVGSNTPLNNFNNNNNNNNTKSFQKLIAQISNENEQQNIQLEDKQNHEKSQDCLITSHSVGGRSPVLSEAMAKITAHKININRPKLSISFSPIVGIQAQNMSSLNSASSACLDKHVRFQDHFEVKKATLKRSDEMQSQSLPLIAFKQVQQSSMSQLETALSATPVKSILRKKDDNQSFTSAASSWSLKALKHLTGVTQEKIHFKKKSHAQKQLMLSKINSLI